MLLIYVFISTTYFAICLFCYGQMFISIFYAIKSLNKISMFVDYSFQLVGFLELVVKFQKF